MSETEGQVELCLSSQQYLPLLSYDKHGSDSSLQINSTPYNWSFSLECIEQFITWFSLNAALLLSFLLSNDYLYLSLAKTRSDYVKLCYFNTFT